MKDWARPSLSEVALGREGLALGLGSTVELDLGGTSESAPKVRAWETMGAEEMPAPTSLLAISSS